MSQKQVPLLCARDNSRSKAPVKWSQHLSRADIEAVWHPLSPMFNFLNIFSTSKSKLCLTTIVLNVKYNVHKKLTWDVSTKNLQSSSVSNVIKAVTAFSNSSLFADMVANVTKRPLREIESHEWLVYNSQCQTQFRFWCPFLTAISVSSQHFFCARNVEAVWHRRSLNPSQHCSQSQTSRISLVERLLRPFDTAWSQYVWTWLNKIMLGQMLGPFDRGCLY